MQLGMIGLGRMGANMVRRLMRGGQECVVYDNNPASVTQLANEGARGSASFDEFVKRLKPPRAAWLMVPAAAVDGTLEEIQQNDLVHRNVFQGKRRQGERLQHRERLGDNENSMAIPAVDPDPSNGTEHQDGDLTGETDQAKQER